MTGMRLDQLLGGIAALEPGDITVSGLTQDSHAVQAGDAFVALAGATRHGIEFAADAAARGAVVVLAEKPGLGTRDSGLEKATSRVIEPRVASSGAAHEPEAGRESASAVSSPESRVPSPEIIWIENLRSHLGQIAARFFGDPSARMEVIGVTGTNGKTSTVHLLAQAFAHLGKQAATIGTLGTGLHGAVHAGERTTPDVIRVHGLLAEFRDAGVTHVAMEVSSHALDQHRVDGVHFDVAVFTNLTRDHLDYHGTMEAYGAAKAKLFAWPALRAAVINVDDAFGRDLATQFEQRDRHPDQGIVIPTMETSSRPGNGRDPAPGTANESSANDGKSTQTSGREKLIRYAIDAADAEVRARDVHTHPDGLAFELATPWGAGHVHSRLLGRFNVANLLAVAGVLGALDVPFTQIHEALESLQPVAGRMHRLGGADAPLVVVDYSHTPDALEQVLATLREHCAGRLICVFGCGGERDVGKRPQMGAIAEKLADVAIVTDDNPRGEDGDAIVAQIVAGMRAPQHATVERDRARAIGLAIAQAHAGDVVLIAGKGHEAYQESAGVRRPFDDTRVAQAAMGVRPC